MAELEAVARFHAHLDECAQCRNHPFSLCRTGRRLIAEAVARPTPSDRETR